MQRLTSAGFFLGCAMVLLACDSNSPEGISRSLHKLDYKVADAISSIKDDATAKAAVARINELKEERVELIVKLLQTEMKSNEAEKMLKTLESEQKVAKDAVRQALKNLSYPAANKEVSFAVNRYNDAGFDAVKKAEKATRAP